MPVTLVSTLLDRVRDATDTNDDQFVENAQLLRWLTVAVPRLDSMVARAGLVRNPSVFSITANGAASYEMSAQAMVILGVYEVIDGRYRQLRAGDPTILRDDSIRAPADQFTATDQGTAGATVVSLRPRPSSGTYQVHYLAQSLALVTGTPGAGETDRVNYPSGWEEWLVLDLARQVAGREESVNQTNEARAREIEREVERMAGERIFSQGPRVRNVDRVERDRWANIMHLSPVDEWYWL